MTSGDRLEHEGERVVDVAGHERHRGFVRTAQRSAKMLHDGVSGPDLVVDQFLLLSSERFAHLGS